MGLQRWRIEKEFWHQRKGRKVRPLRGRIRAGGTRLVGEGGDDQAAEKVADGKTSETLEDDLAGDALPMDLESDTLVTDLSVDIPQRLAESEKADGGESEAKRR